MPSKNTIKDYVEGGYYHVYNRGVEKRIIFQNDQDYAFFLSLMKEYLLPEDHPDIAMIKQQNPRRVRINCSEDVDLLAYCLMPNHFHLFLKLKRKGGLQRFMRALLTGYSIYFNQKNDRVGHLFQGRYKATLVQSDPYLMHLSRYIHTNPKELLAEDSPLQDYPYSSYSIYLGKKKCEWVNEDIILKMFSDQKEKSRKLYREFVEGDVDSEGLLGDLVLE